MTLAGKIWDFICGWDRSRASTASEELKEFARIGGLMLDVKHHLKDKEWAKNLTLQHIAKFMVLDDKYRICPADDEGDRLITKEHLHRARRNAEIYDAYGYLRGKRKIRQERK